jgi:hypothetical protein
VNFFYKLKYLSRILKCRLKLNIWLLRPGLPVQFFRFRKRAKTAAAQACAWKVFAVGYYWPVLDFLVIEINRNASSTKNTMNILNLIRPMGMRCIISFGFRRMQTSY